MKVTITHTACADKTLKWTYITTTIKGKTIEEIENKFKALHPYSTAISAYQHA